jgi:uncharacterized membrane protein (DUF4010 family)
MLDELFASVSPTVLQLLLATALGTFLGLEREWSGKTAGIRTFALITLAGAVFTILGHELLLVVGALLVVAQGVFMGVRGLFEEDHGLSLTTSVSLFVAYGVGILVPSGYALEGVVVALLSSLLLVLKRELHGFARELSHEEVRSASELAILAFVVYPLLPTEPIGPWNAIDPRTVWLLVIAMSAIGFANYVLIQTYGAEGIGLSGFLGGLVNSTAVVGELASRASGAEFDRLAVGGILLAISAMSFRNAVIVVLFLPELALLVGVPLVVMTLAGIAISLRVGDWTEGFEAEFDSPFSLKSALKFGTLFLVVLVASAAAQATVGEAGFVLTSALGGLVSSGSVATTAVVLVGNGQLAPTTAAVGVVVATAVSVATKVALAASMRRSIGRPVGLASAALIAVGALTTAAVVALA